MNNIKITSTPFPSLDKFKDLNKKNKTQDIFSAVKCTEFCNIEEHKNMSFYELRYLSCSCGLVKAGCYQIMWDGPGLGLVADTKDEAERIAYCMNVAWRLAKNEQ